MLIVGIFQVLTPGKRIYIDDGLISVKALEIGPDYVLGEIENGGNLGSRKGCNLPATDTDLPAVSPKDMQDLQVKNEKGVCVTKIESFWYIVWSTSIDSHVLFMDCMINLNDVG